MRVPFEKVPIDVRRRAARAIAALTTEHMWPGDQREIEARFGFEVTCGYAMSETPYGLVWLHGERPYGALGSARQHPELGHVNDARVIEDGRPVAVGEIGELELRNPCVMRGYYEMPERRPR